LWENNETYQLFNQEKIIKKQSLGIIYMELQSKFLTTSYKGRLSGLNIVGTDIDFAHELASFEAKQMGRVVIEQLRKYKE
jgi:hypothetical protein